MKALRDEVGVFDHPTLGRTLAVLPAIPDNAPYRVREGIARRRIAAITGACPCGARAAMNGEGNVVQFEHEARCPATAALLAKAIRRWAA